MIYDLYGMPGSGKSTICKRLENEIGIKNAKDKYIEKIVGRIIFRLYLKLYFLDSISRKMYKRITNIIGNLNKYENCMNKKTDISLYIKYMLFDYFLERKIKKDVIIDEGIIHYGISLFVEFGLEEEKMKQIIELLKLDKVKYIGLKISIEECLNFHDPPQLPLSAPVQ